mgnify:CR=1 FL=1
MRFLHGRESQQTLGAVSSCIDGEQHFLGEGSAIKFTHANWYPACGCAQRYVILSASF